MFRKKMAGSPSSKGTIPRRRKAAGTSVPKPKTTNNAKLTSREFSFRNAISEYLFCLLNGGVCAAGGWNFNWSPDIKQALLKWHTHFGDIYDDVLTVGKFENDDFPVRGNATIAKRYIGEKIASTDYEFYWNDKYDRYIYSHDNNIFFGVLYPLGDMEGTEHIDIEKYLGE